MENFEGENEGMMNENDFFDEVFGEVEGVTIIDEDLSKVNQEVVDQTISEKLSPEKFDEENIVDVTYEGIVFSGVKESELESFANRLYDVEKQTVVRTLKEAAEKIRTMPMHAGCRGDEAKVKAANLLLGMAQEWKADD